MSTPPLCIGTSLKMYFGYRQTLDWCRQIAALARRHPAVVDGHVELFVLPAFPVLAPVLEIFSDTGAGVGSQDLHHADSGAFTGEVSAAMLREMGCGYAEVGHAERRRLFNEDEATVAAKTAAALRHGLTPVLCVGEAERGSIDQAAAECIAQLDSALAGAPRSPAPIVAYEPHWAIGASEPASSEHIGGVCVRLREHLSFNAEARVIYGGSAGPGLLSRLAGQVEGLFLGRFAHDPSALERILDEAATLGHVPRN